MYWNCNQNVFRMYLCCICWHWWFQYILQWNSVEMPAIISAMTINKQLILNSNTFEILTQYMPNTIFNTSDTSDTSSIQTQYIQILPIHPDFAGLMYWMYLDVFDVNTSSKPRIHPKYTIIHGKYICLAPPVFRFWRKHQKTTNTWYFQCISHVSAIQYIQHVLKTGSMYWYIQYCLIHGSLSCLRTCTLNTS